MVVRERVKNIDISLQEYLLWDLELLQYTGVDLFELFWNLFWPYPNALNFFGFSILNFFILMWMNIDIFFWILFGIWIFEER